MNDEQLLDGLLKEWASYSDSSEVWIFQSSRNLKGDIAEDIIEKARHFASQWSSHGTALVASASLFYERFLIFIVNGSDGPSGCSKDSLTHFIQSIGGAYEIDFFNRMQVIYKDFNGELLNANLNDFKEMHEKNEITGETIVFNNLAKNKLDLINNWEVRLKDSWHLSFI